MHPTASHALRLRPTPYGLTCSPHRPREQPAQPLLLLHTKEPAPPFSQGRNTPTYSILKYPPFQAFCLASARKLVGLNTNPGHKMFKNCCGRAGGGATRHRRCAHPTLGGATPPKHLNSSNGRMRIGSRAPHRPRFPKNNLPKYVSLCDVCAMCVRMCVRGLTFDERS